MWALHDKMPGEIWSEEEIAKVTQYTPAEELLELGMSAGSQVLDNYPIESTKFALAVIGALPVFIMFPYLQKYYAKGIMIGSTKG